MLGGFLLYRVQGESMAPSLRQGDYLLAQRMQGRSNTARGNLSRGDIVAVDLCGQIQIKRIIGLPKERISLMQGILLVDGERLLEPYLKGLPPYLGLEDSDYEMKQDEYFMMGDNRSHSTDSRHYGPVQRSRIEGKMKCRVWPLPLRWGGKYGKL